MRETTAIKKASALNDYDELVDIKTVKLRDGVSRLENAMYFLEQIKNPRLFRVGDDIVELCFAVDERLSLRATALRLYAGGFTVKQITDELNEKRIKSSRGAEFNKNSLHKILENKKYIGFYTYNGIEIKGGVPRIISDELFDKVQEILAKNKKAPARATDE